jgi:hypothetical protein
VPRLRGSGGHRIQYRHIIDWLVRKPGAFENYRYHKDMFPTHRFRMAYDGLRQNSKEYLKILHLAAKESETAVDQALSYLINKNLPITFNTVFDMVSDNKDYSVIQDIRIDMVDIGAYDRLLGKRMSV